MSVHILPRHLRVPATGRLKRPFAFQDLGQIGEHGDGELQRLVRMRDEWSGPGSRHRDARDARGVQSVTPTDSVLLRLGTQSQNPFARASKNP